MEELDYYFVYQLNTPHKINEFIQGLLKDFKEASPPKDTAIDELIFRYTKAAEAAEIPVYEGIYSLFVKELKALSRAEV